MKRRRFLTITASALLATTGLGASSGRAKAARWSGTLLGADGRIDLEGPDAEAALQAVTRELERFEMIASLYRPDSALCRLNREGRLPKPPADLLALCQLSTRLHTLTTGRFDPTVQPLWRASAEGGDREAARRRIDWNKVRFNEGEIRVDPGQALTFNGIAQGYAADLAARLLKARGFTHVLIDTGEFSALGGPYALGIADPAFGILGKLTLTERAAATSSPNAMHVGGEPHILSPTGEKPLWSTVCVEAKSAALADGLSTAFVFHSQAEIAAIRRRLPELCGVHLIDADGDMVSV